MFEFLSILSGAELLTGLSIVGICLIFPKRLNKLSDFARDSIIFAGLFFLFSGLHNLILLGIYGLTGF